MFWEGILTGRVSGIGECGDEGSAILGLEESRAGYERICASIATASSGFDVNSTINLDPELKSFVGAPVGDCLNCGKDILPKSLAAEAGRDGHGENEIDLVEKRFDRFGGSSGVEGDTAEATKVADPAEGLADIVARFDVNCDLVGPGLDKRVDVILRVGEHEMGIEKEGGFFVETGDHLGTEGEIGDKVPVHDIEVDPVEGGILDLAGTGEEIEVVSGEDRRGEKRCRRLHLLNRGGESFRFQTE